MSQANPLFRPQAFATLTGTNAYDDALRVMRPRHWVAGGFAVGLLLAAILWSAVFRVPVSVTGQGILLTQGGLIDVVADASGQIRDLTVRPGDDVTAGMVVARISQPDIDLQLDAALAALDDARKAQTALKQFQARDAATRQTAMQARAASLADRIAALNDRRDALAKKRDSLSYLVNGGVITKDQLMTATGELMTANSQIADARDELVTQSTSAAVRLTEDEKAAMEADRHVAEAQRQVGTLRRQLDRLGAVRSPFEGHVVESKVNIGQMTQAGTPIVTLERDGTARLPILVAYVNAGDGKKIMPGMPVEVSPATTRREEHGFIRGRVVRVSDVPASSAGLMRTLQNDRLVQTFQSSLGAPFEVTVALDPDPDDPARPLWSSRRVAPPPVRAGTLAETRITVRSTSLIALAIPALRSVLPAAVAADGR